MLTLILSLAIADMAGAGYAAASPPPTGEAPSVAVARAFLFDLQAMDVPAALSHFAADGVQEKPFAPKGFPSRLEGIDALARQYGGLPQTYDSMRFDITSAHALDDPQWAVLEYHGTIRQKNGRSYDNDDVGLFRVVEAGSPCCGSISIRSSCSSRSATTSAIPSHCLAQGECTMAAVSASAGGFAESSPTSPTRSSRINPFKFNDG